MNSIMLYRVRDIFYKVGLKWDEYSLTKDNVIEFAHKYINEEPVRMLDSRTESLEYYLAHYGEWINMSYRSGSVHGRDKDIADMLATHTTQHPVIVYRGVCAPVFKQMIENAKGIDGVDLLDTAFLSTSLVKGQEIPYKHRLRIYVPQGTQAVYLGNVNDEQFYYEVVIQCGTGLKIISADRKYINCEIVAQDIF